MEKTPCGVRVPCSETPFHPGTLAGLTVTCQAPLAWLSVPSAAPPAIARFSYGHPVFLAPQDNYDLEDISDIFFKEFFFRAPVLQAYFVKPTKMQRVMFEKAVNMIVKSVRDVNVHNIELKGIAMRHIKYDITVDHLKTFGTVLMNVLKNTVGEDHWDEEVR